MRTGATALWSRPPAAPAYPAPMPPRTAATDLLARTPLVDGHNDLPWALRLLAEGEADGPEPDLAAGEPRLHTDLPRLRAGAVGAQFWSVYVPGSFTGDSAVTAVFEQIDRVHRLAARYPGDSPWPMTRTRPRRCSRAAGSRR